MFKKLLSNLPFNPSLINQISFYAKRIHGEASVRRTGLILLTLALFVQTFAVLSPPQSSVSASPNNDLVDGGFSNRDQAVLHCINHNEDYYKILAYYGISCDDVAKASTVTLDSRDYGSKLFSMGRLPYHKAGEQPVTISDANNDQSLWLRYLWSWDTHSSSKYQALTGVTKEGLRFFMLYNCGNLVFIGIPTPVKPPVPPKKPCPYNPAINIESPACKPCEASQTRDDKTACITPHKTAANITQKITNANGTTAKPGDTIEYTLTVENRGKAIFTKFSVQENISDVLDYADVVSLHGGTINKNGLITWPPIDIAAKKSIKKTITVRVKDPIPSTPTSTSDRGHFDLKMTNVYGDTVTIKVPPTITKQTEIVTSQLPNTGPGLSLVIGFGITTVAGYFFARSKLMGKELDAVKKDYSTSGEY